MKKIVLLLLILIVPFVAAADFQVKWTLNWTEQGLPAPAWMSPTYADIDGDGKIEILYNPGEQRLVALEGTGKIDWVFPPLDQDGEASVGKYHSIADIDGDGAPDVIMGSKTKIYKLDKDGNGEVLYETEDFGYVQGIIARDINQDGKLDIVVCSIGIHLLVIDNTGQEMLKIHPVPPGRGVDSVPNAFDFDKDGDVEIIVQSRGLGEGPGEGNVPGNLMIYSSTGTEEWRFSGAIFTDWLHSQPSIGDINGDGEYEIVTSFWKLDSGSTGGIVALSFYGTELWRWQSDVAQTGSAPVIVDLDGDGAVEVIQNCRGGFLLCFDGKTGNIKWRFDYAETAPRNTIATTCGDMDGDGKLDIAFTTWNNCTAFVVSNTGEKIAMLNAGGEATASTAIGDFDGDGTIDILLCSNDVIHCLTLGAAYNPALTPWPMHMVDSMRSGVVPIPEVAGLFGLALPALLWIWRRKA